MTDEAANDATHRCDDLADTKSKGPGPARNFAWDHAIAAGATCHWVMDDNIYGFLRLVHNDKVPCGDGTPMRCMEDFALRYTNVAMVGPNYDKFAIRRETIPPYVANSRRAPAWRL